MVRFRTAAPLDPRPPTHRLAVSGSPPTRHRRLIVIGMFGRRTEEEAAPEPDRLNPDLCLSLPRPLSNTNVSQRRQIKTLHFDSESG